MESTTRNFSYSDGTIQFFTELLNTAELACISGTRHKIHNIKPLTRLCTTILGVFPETEQLCILEGMMDLIRYNCSNVEICLSVQLHHAILDFFHSNDLFHCVSMNSHSISRLIARKLLRLYFYLCRYSVDMQHIQRIFSVLLQSPHDSASHSLNPDIHSVDHTASQSLAHKTSDTLAELESNRSTNTPFIQSYLTMIEKMTQDFVGPTSFFDLSGENSGLLLQKCTVFPSHGYTFCAWLYFETLAIQTCPLFHFSGANGIGIEASFQHSTLILTNIDKEKHTSVVRIPNVIVCGAWMLLYIVHSYRPIRGSRIEVFANRQLLHDGKFPYPNVSLMNPIAHASIGLQMQLLSQSTDHVQSSLKVLLGPIALLGQTLSHSVIRNIYSAEEFDTLILQFNAYIHSSNHQTHGNHTLSSLNFIDPAHSHSITDGLLFGLDARNGDQAQRINYDSSGNECHAELTVRGVEWRCTSPFKHVIARFGGPLTCLLFLFSAVSASDLLPTPCPQILTYLRTLFPIPFNEQCAPKAIRLIAELLRHSLIHKFIFKRHAGVRCMALLLRSLPASYFSRELFQAIESMREAVLSDRVLVSDISISLLYNFRIWVNAELALQCSIFDSVQKLMEGDTSEIASAFTIRHLLHALIWIYHKKSDPRLDFLRNRSFTEQEIQVLRNKVLSLIRCVLCKPVLSYENTRTLVYCMIGKATHPLRRVSTFCGISAGKEEGSDSDCAAIAERVPNTDLEDLLELLMDLLTAQREEIYAILCRLGGINIWLSLFECEEQDFPRARLLRFLRALLHGNGSNRMQLSVSESFRIVSAVRKSESSKALSYEMYRELFDMLLGRPLSSDNGKLEEETIWHANMIFPLLHALQSCTLTVRMIAIRQLTRVFASETAESACNRRILMNHQRQSALDGASTLFPAHVPILEAFLSLYRDSEHAEPERILMKGISNAPVRHLREIAGSDAEEGETRRNAAFSMIEMGDHAFLFSLLQSTALTLDMELFVIDLLAHNATEQSQIFVSQAIIQFLAVFVRLEAECNEIAWTIVQDPLTALAHLSLPKVRERVALTLLKCVLCELDKWLTHTARFRPQIFSRESNLMRNTENIAKICAVIVLQYEVDSDLSVNHAFWRCESVMEGEEELLNAILNVWRQLTPFFHAEVDASFHMSRRVSLEADALASNAQAYYLRPHPGGPMRQILQLLLRSFYVSFASLKTDDEEAETMDSDEEYGILSLAAQRALALTHSDSSALRKTFMNKIRKLEYFLDAMKLGMEDSRSHFRETVLHEPNASNLILQSRAIKAKTGNETALVLWFIPELLLVIDKTEKLQWNEESERLMRLTTLFLKETYTCVKEMKTLLHDSEWIENMANVRRRDAFYSEQLAHSRESRVAIKKSFLSQCQKEMKMAGMQMQSAVSHSLPIWLLRLRARDLKDSNRLFLYLQWTVRVIWTEQKEPIAFWRLSPYVSSNWVRNRLVPETEACRSKRIVQRPQKAELGLATEAGLLRISSLEEGEASSEMNDLFSEGQAPKSYSKDTKHSMNKMHAITNRFSTKLRRRKVSKDVKKPMVESNEILEELEGVGPELDAEHLVKAPCDSESGTTKTSKHKKGIHNYQWKNLMTSYRTEAYLHSYFNVLIHGVLQINSTALVFEGAHITCLHSIGNCMEDKEHPIKDELNELHISELSHKVWSIRVVRSMYRRRFLLDQDAGLELFFIDGSSCFFGFCEDGDAELIYAMIKERKPPCLTKTSKLLVSADRMFARNKWTEMWRRREISNFEYLMLLNIAAGRTYNDITQYPVLPWILKDYTSTTLNLDDPESYRDLSKPIGAQTLEMEQRTMDLYEQKMHSDRALSLPYHFPVVYSNVQSVLFFLIRTMPFTVSDLHEKENGIAPFNSIAEAFDRCTDAESSFQFELTPEFFTMPDILSSERNQNLTRSESTDIAKSVTLPPYAHSAYDFIHQHRLALESDHVSANLHHWIDLVFGYKQWGPAALGSCNTYPVSCFPERIDFSALNVPIRANLCEKGTVPIQLFRKPHLQRMTQDEALEALYPASHAIASLSSRMQVRRYDLQSKHLSRVSKIWFSSALMAHTLMSVVHHTNPGLGSGSGMGAHSSASQENSTLLYTCDDDGLVLARRYINNVPDPLRSCPFSIFQVDHWWRLPKGCVVRGGMVFYEHMISCGYWDGSWRMHWAADGELLQRIAFHKKPILCMAHSEDDFTGDLALAFGSEDCMISVWALSKMAAARPRRLFTKKEMPVGRLPWVLLCGHTSPVTAVALHVDLDVVVSSSANKCVLIHSLRSEMVLHRLEIGSQPGQHVQQLTISLHGDIMIHTCSKEHSELVLLTHNGVIVSRDQLISEDGSSVALLDQSMCFTRSGEYIITATADTNAAVEIRSTRDTLKVMRRIECKRDVMLSCIGISYDERMVLCGYTDGALIAYALHFGISDGCKSIGNWDKKAREQEAQALARANRPKQAQRFRKALKYRGREQNGSLWIRSGKSYMPESSALVSMQDCYSKLKKPCASGNEAYEHLLRKFWYAIYKRDEPIDLLHGSTESGFERIGESWSRLGFQRPDPTTDFRAGGMLSLYCLLYFASNFEKRTSEMIAHQIPGSHEHTYPWGPAGINLTCMVARFFWNFCGELCRDRSDNWPLFSTSDAFYILFCEVFLLFDYLWKEMNADYGSFSKVMAVTRHRVCEVLEIAKGDMDLFAVELKSQNAGMMTRNRSRCIAYDDDNLIPSEMYVIEESDFLMEYEAEEEESHELLELEVCEKAVNDEPNRVEDPFAGNDLRDLIHANEEKIEEEEC